MAKKGIFGKLVKAAVKGVTKDRKAVAKLLKRSGKDFNKIK